MFIKNIIYLFLFCFLLSPKASYANKDSLGSESSSEKSISISIIAQVQVSNVEQDPDIWLEDQGYLMEENDICIYSNIMSSYQVTAQNIHPYKDHDYLDYEVFWSDGTGHHANLSNNPEGVEFKNADSQNTKCQNNQNAILSIKIANNIEDKNDPYDELLLTIGPN